jgi:hypothetical protein
MRAAMWCGAGAARRSAEPGSNKSEDPILISRASCLCARPLAGADLFGQPVPSIKGPVSLEANDSTAPVAGTA